MTSIMVHEIYKEDNSFDVVEMYGITDPNEGEYRGKGSTNDEIIVEKHLSAQGWIVKRGYNPVRMNELYDINLDYERLGCPDFVLFKVSNDEIQEIKFVEVKTIRMNLLESQKEWILNEWPTEYKYEIWEVVH